MFYEEIPVNYDTIFKLPPSVLEISSSVPLKKIEENNNMDILSLSAQVHPPTSAEHQTSATVPLPAGGLRR